MQQPSIPLRLVGAPEATRRVRARLRPAGWHFSDDAEDAWAVFVGPAAQAQVLRRLLLVVSPSWGAAETQLLQRRLVDVVLESASDDELAARLNAAVAGVAARTSLATAALPGGHDFFERLVDASTDAIIAADLRGRLLVFNRAAERLFGVSADEARRRLTARDLYPCGGAQEVMRLLRGSPTGQIEAVRAYGRTMQDETVPIELSAAIVFVDGRPVATVGHLRDLRERVRVESELARTRMRLLEAEKQAAITALAGATAHELNQPLTAIAGYVELLKRQSDEATASPLNVIAQQTERMTEIVRRIAKLTRVETVAYPGERQIADLERSSSPPPPRPSGKD